MDNSNQNEQQQFDNDENMEAEADEHGAEPMVNDADDGGGAAINVENVAAAPAADAEAQINRNPEEAEEFYGFSERDNNLDSVANLAKIMLIWETKHTQPGFDPAPLIKKLAEIVEKEKEIYMRKDPDPFDDRHPYRVFYTCEFGFLLKQLFRKDLFMNKLVNDYMRDNYFTRQNVPKSSLELNILACRLILVIMPGLETSAVFQPEYDNLINRIYSWAEDSIEPLQSYATGLLASAMEVSEIAVLFREQNTRLIPKMLKRLHMLQAIYKFGRTMTPKSGQDVNISAWLNKPVTELKEKHNPTARSHQKIASKPPDVKINADTEPDTTINGTSDTHEVSPLESYVGTTNINILMENSMDSMSPSSVGGNSSGPGTHKKNYIPIHPPTQESSQMLILRYLTSMGEYQEFLGLVIENYAMDVIFGYLDIIDRRDTCLVFEALKYLASLLCHKKFALDFISRGGLERLLKVPRPGIASTGVSIALYYLAYSEDAMERICTFPRPIVSELVEYVLWIVGHSYDSGRCHATMFFGLSFQFKVILEEFDAKDGLRKMYNVISVLKILNPPADGNSTLNEDEECACRQMVRHVCVALKRYMESHLFYKYHALMNDQYPNSSLYALQPPKAMKSNLEQISEQIRTLQEHTNVRTSWAPVDQLIKLGGITLLLKIITFAYEWNNGGRSETLRSALDVLSICCVVPRVFNTYCERLSLPDDESTSGIFVILGAAAGDLASDADVQKSALAALCNCVCAPIYKKENSKMIKCFGSASKRQKLNNKYMEDLVEKVWESVCSNNGIIVLLSLMQTKVPITDADCIRGMACRALAGLARSERVRQIVGKLPLYTSGQIQALMRDPILQEKRAEHVVFQKYALELLQRVSGKLKPFNSQLDPSLVNIHKANVIAQTKIQYNEQQLYQLIHDHLVSKGLSQTAQTLRNEAGLQIQAPTTRNFHQSPFDYKVQPTGAIVRQRLRSRMQDVTNAIMNDHETMPRTQYNGEETPTTSSAPIKLVKSKQHLGSSSSLHLAANNANGSGSGGAGSLTPQTHRSLQKQISSLSDLLHGGSTPSSEEYPAAPPSVTLNTIVTEYLTNQHALCKNPMTTCPQFDLLAPHKCPDPKPSRVLGPSVNMTSRLFQSQAGFNTSRLDRRYVHSNFAPWRTIRSNDYSELQFSCCDIVTAANSNQLIVGTSLGEAKVFNMNDGNEEFTHTCHSDCIDFIKSNRAGNLVLTSCSWRSPLSVLWSVANNDFSAKLDFQDDYYCEFSNLNQDKILGTQNDRAVVYDLVTGNVISTFTPQIANQYTKNRATFNPTDELILSDGVLWDVRSGRHIHKFDKLNQTLSGVFHTNGLEIISNTEVWDLRTFHLLQTVPVLNQCTLKFSPLNVLYGVSIDFESRIIFDETTNYETSFKVLDAFDYSSIATIDVKRHIYDLSVSRDGSLIALVENQLGFESKQETYVKIYTVGVKKNEQQDEVGVNTNATVAANNEAVRNGGAGASMMRDASIAIGESHTRRRRRLFDAGDVIGERGVEAAAAAAPAPAPAPPAAAVAGGGGGGGGGGDGGVGVGMDVRGYNLAAMDIVNDLILNGRPVRRDNNVVHRGVGRRRRVVTGEGGDLDIIWFPDGRNRLQVENRTRFSSRAAPTGAGAVAAAAGAAAGEGAASVARSPRRVTLNHMLAAATSTYRRLARIRTARRAGRQRGPTVPARVSGIGVVRPPRPRPRLAHNNNNNNNNNINNNNNDNNNNNATNGRANVAAATPAAAFANASNPVLLHHGVRRRRGGVDDIDFVMLEELDLLANNLISMLAGR